MSGTEVRASLEAQRKQTIQQMVEESERSKRLMLSQMVFALEAAMASLPEDQSQTEYGRFKRVRDAVEAYLRTAGRPVPAQQVIDALIEGGLRRKPLDNANPSAKEILDHSRTVILKSISFHLVNPRGIRVNLIKEVNGKVGLCEWPDSKFEG